jgi:hypothetical protein
VLCSAVRCTDQRASQALALHYCTALLLLLQRGLPLPACLCLHVLTCLHRGRLPCCRAACLQIQRRDWRCASCGSERDVAAIEERLCAMLQQVGGERGTLG